MLTVLKRSGRIETFDPEKIKHTLASASDELGRPMNQADIDRLVEPVVRLAEGKQPITTREIYETIVKSMAESGFTQLAEAYRTNTGNYWAEATSV
jgi:transcriptional regulator NrdR family protein